MTDKQMLVAYRLKQAEETLSDAERMLGHGMSSRSIVNRAYYSMFYAILALFLSANLSPRTSKHSGIISIFDREFIHTGRMDRSMSKAFHRLFDARQEGDYREFVEISSEETAEYVKIAWTFVEAVKDFMAKNPF